MNWLRRVRFFVLGILCIWVTHSLAYFLHEYAHSFAAWLLGCKANPWALDYGTLNLKNVLFLAQVDENVDYSTIFAHGRGHAAAFIAFAGAGIGNGLLYVLARLLLGKAAVRMKRWLFSLLFWIEFMCLGNFYDYFPARTFASHGDMAHIADGLRISPWLIVVAFGYPIAWALWHFFARALPDALPLLGADTKTLRLVVVVTCVVGLFGYFGSSGYFGYGEVSHTLSGLSMLAVPGVIVACCFSARMRSLGEKH